MLSEEQLVPFLKTLVCRGPGDLKFPGADTLLTELPGKVHPLCAQVMKILYMFVQALNV